MPGIGIGLGVGFIKGISDPFIKYLNASGETID